MNLPNLLTLLRMAMVPVLVALVLHDAYGAALAMFVLAGLTDGLDGFIARRFDQRSALGAILDPLADKFLLVSSFLCLTFHDAPVQVPPWLTAVVLARDLILLGGAALFLREGRREFRPSLLGKSTTVTQILFVGFVLLDNLRGTAGPLHRPLAFLSLAATAVSGVHYLGRGIREARLKSA